MNTGCSLNELKRAVDINSSEMKCYHNIGNFSNESTLLCAHTCTHTHAHPKLKGFTSPIRGYKAFMDWAKGEGDPFPYYVYGAACSEVEIDCLTGAHKVI